MPTTMGKQINVTLKSELAEQDADAVERIRRKLVGVQMLACIQNNLMDDIRRILEEKKRWRYELKHNMKQIQDLCARNIRTDSFFGKLSQEALDVYFEDYEALEKMVYDFIEK